MGILKSHRKGSRQKDIFGQYSGYVMSLQNVLRREYIHLIPFMIRYVASRLIRRPLDFSKIDLSSYMISIDFNQGRFLYNMVLSIKPKVIFEFGLSHGISALYLGQALNRQGFGLLYSSEIEQNKIEVAKRHIEKVGLKKQIQILEGDVLDTIASIPQPIEFVHMDGFPNLNLDVLKKIEPKLATDSVIITDDVNLFSMEMSTYIDVMMNSGRYSSVILPLSTGVMVSIKN